MAEANLVNGNRFRLYRQNDETTTTFDYIGLATTLSFTRSSDYEDATAPDLVDPLVTPNRKSSRKSRSWDLAFSGRVDAKALEKIEADEADEDPHVYRIMVDKEAADGGKHYEGPIWFESLEVTKSENGFATFSAKARGDGAFTTAAAS